MPHSKLYYEESKTTVFGVIDFIKRLVKGFIIAFVFLIISNFIDIAFGYAWRETTYIIILIILTGYSVFHMVKKFTHASLFYLMGWIVGIYVFGKLGVIPNNKGMLYVMVPLIVYLFRLICSFFQKKSIQN